MCGTTRFCYLCLGILILGCRLRVGFVFCGVRWWAEPSNGSELSNIV